MTTEDNSDNHPDKKFEADLDASLFAYEIYLSEMLSSMASAVKAQVEEIFAALGVEHWDNDSAAVVDVWVEFCARLQRATIEFLLSSLRSDEEAIALLRSNGAPEDLIAEHESRGAYERLSSRALTAFMRSLKASDFIREWVNFHFPPEEEGVSA